MGIRGTRQVERSRNGDRRTAAVAGCVARAVAAASLLAFLGGGTARAQEEAPDVKVDEVVPPGTDPAPESAGGEIADADVMNLDIVQADEAQQAEINNLIYALASVNYMERSDAHERLLEIGPAAYKSLRDAYVTSDDLELRMRIAEIVEKSFHEHFVYLNIAFLGISLNGFQPRLVPDVPLEDGTEAVTINNVIEGTAAFKAGLEASDVVVALDGEPIAITEADMEATRGDRNRALVNNFSSRIAAHKPGDKVLISYYRGAELFEQSVHLGILPEHMRKNSNVAAINKAMDESRRNFKAWWVKHFTRYEAELIEAATPPAIGDVEIAPGDVTETGRSPQGKAAPEAPGSASPAKDDGHE